MCPSPRAQTNRWESLTVATKGVTSSLQIKWRYQSPQKRTRWG
jgi:hypothetical protein